MSLEVTEPAICIEALYTELKHHPDREYVNYLVTGLTEGFHTGIDPLPTVSYECTNNLSARKDPDTTTRLLIDEVSKGYMIGPFHEPPFEVFRINPLSLAEKKYSGKKRLVVDMSSPHDDGDFPSINSLICKEDFRLSYVKIDEAIKIIQTLGRGSWLCKTDLVDAFKTVPVHPTIWPFQGVKWNGNYYFWTR